MRNRLTVRALLMALVLALLTLLVPAALADEEAAAAIVLTDEGVVVPEGLTAGVVPLLLQNDTEEAFFAPFLLGLTEGYTLEDLEAAFAEDPNVPPEWIVMYGGTSVEPGAMVEAQFLLEAGEYAVLDFASEMPVPVGFTVAEATEEAGELPEADVVVSLLDFAFSVPAELSAGPQLWEFVNEGAQWHELVLLNLGDAELTQDELMDLLMTSEEMPAGMEMVFTWLPVSEGTSTWANLDLEPGNYAMLCFLPDLASEEMMPHAMHGMISLVTVSE